MKPYYDYAGITIYHGDCREVLPTLGKFDLLLTDPPYEVEARGGAIGSRRKYLADIHQHIDSGFDINMVDQFPNWIVFCAKKQLVRLLQKAEKKVWSLVTWNKPNPTPLYEGTYLPDTEYIIHAYSSGMLFGDYKDKSRFIVHRSVRNNFNHPTVKPLAVIIKMMKLGSQKNHAILDPFMGSGTTLRAAKDLGRKAVGIEIEEKYCEIAAQRLSQEVMELGV